MSSKRYPDKFKIEAAKQVPELGYPMAEVAKRLGITTHSLHAWKKKFGPDSVEHNEKEAAEQEIRPLEKELKRERMKRHIYATRSKTRIDIVDYIEMLYNNKRRQRASAE